MACDPKKNGYKQQITQCEVFVCTLHTDYTLEKHAFDYVWVSSVAIELRYTDSTLIEGKSAEMNVPWHMLQAFTKRHQENHFAQTKNDLQQQQRLRRRKKEL